MKTGNVRQVMILSAVAIGAIGFLGNTLLGLGKSVVSSLRQADPAEKDAPADDAAPSQLMGDPFFHPRLANAIAATPPKPETKVEPPAAAPDAMQGQFGALPGPIPVRPDVTAVPEPPSQPAENTGIDRKEDGETAPRIGLTAVVKVDKPVAFLSLNGGDSRAFRPGDLVAPGLRLLTVADGFVIFRSPKASYRLSVGQEIQP